MECDRLRDLIAEAYWNSVAWRNEPAPSDDVANVVLAIRIPWLCPDCKGGWRAGLVPTPCYHPNAPTIADAVALWEAVHLNNFAVDPPTAEDLEGGLRHAYACGSDACWEALRAVRA